MVLRQKVGGATEWEIPTKSPENYKGSLSATLAHVKVLTLEQIRCLGLAKAMICPTIHAHCGGSLWITLKGFHMKTEVTLVTMYSYLVIIVSNRGAGGVNGLSFV